MRENTVESINNIILEEPEFEYDGNNKDQLIRLASYKLSNVIKEYFEDRNPLTQTASVYADLLNSAIRCLYSNGEILVGKEINQARID